jgi:hypothetical protein
LNEFHLSVPDLHVNGGGASPFDQIRRTDAYGREYWDGREMQPHMGYARWQTFQEVIEKAKESLALIHGTEAAETAFMQVSQLTQAGNLGDQNRMTYRLTRFGAYLTAMAGDGTKEAVAAARVYFAVRTREAELGSLEATEIRRTALARAREMIDYRTFRDMMSDNAPDYVPSSKETGLHFAKMQNKLYLHLTGMTADQIRATRPLRTWPGCEEGKPEPSAKATARKVAKNYLDSSELTKLDRLVGRLCLRAEDITEDGLHLSLAQWDHVVDMELAVLRIPLAA